MLRNKYSGTLLSAFTLIGVLLGTSLTAYADRDKRDHRKHNENWVATWGTAVKAPTPVFDPPGIEVNDVTLRQIVRISVGGKKFRVWFTNEFGNAPLTIDAAHIARRDIDSAIQHGTGRKLSFGGRSSITIPPGSKVLSDPVKLRAPDLAELAISIYIKENFTATQSPVTFHVRALQTNYVVDGKAVKADALPGAREATQWYFLSGVDVAVRHPIPVIVALGDSITDGDQVSTAEPVDLNHRYTDFLAELILTGKSRRYGKRAAIVNAGISGGQVRDTLIGESALARLDRDVLARTGATHLIFIEGINDIGLANLLNILVSIDLFPPIEDVFGRPLAPASAKEIIAAHKQIIARANAAGLKVIGGTLPPAGNSLPGYSGEIPDATRAAVNNWIRKHSDYDIVIDFDKLLRDPDDPNVMAANLTADNLHPSSAGYQAMAEDVFRKLFRDQRHRHKYDDEDHDDDDD